MIFDVGQIRIGFNLNVYDPYNRLIGPCSQLLFFFLACWLLIVRVVLCVVIVIMYKHDNDNATSICIILSIVLICVWFIMFVLAIKFYIHRDDTTSGARTATTKLNHYKLKKKMWCS